MSNHNWRKQDAATLDPEKFYSILQNGGRDAALEYAQGMLNCLNTRRKWLTETCTELVAIAMIDGLVEMFPEKMEEWQGKYKFAFDERETIKLLVNEKTLPRPGWNDYYMVRWSFTHDPKYVERLLDRICEYAPYEAKAPISSSCIWMLSSVSQRQPELLQQIAERLFSIEFGDKWPSDAGWLRVGFLERTKDQR